MYHQKVSCQRKAQWPGHVIALLTVACWGCTFVNTKYLLNGGMLPQEIFLVRFLLAYLCILFLSPRKKFCDSWRDELLMVVLGMTGGSVYFLAENTAVGISYVDNVAFIVCSAPLLTTIMALATMKNVKASPQLILGSGMALAGMGTVIFNGHFILHLDPLGDLLALAAALCWAVYSLLMKRATERYSAIFITRKVFFYGLVTILPVFLFKSWDFPLEGFKKPDIWMNLLFLGVIASFVCFLLWNWAIGRIGALKTSNYVYLNPLTTVIASALFLHEPLTPMAILGGALILSGVFLANRSKNI